MLVPTRQYLLSAGLNNWDINYSNGLVTVKGYTVSGTIINGVHQADKNILDSIIESVLTSGTATTTKKVTYQPSPDVQEGIKASLTSSSNGFNLSSLPLETIIKGLVIFLVARWFIR